LITPSPASPPTKALMPPPATTQTPLQTTKGYLGGIRL